MPFARQNELLDQVGRCQRLIYHKGETVISADDIDAHAVLVIEGSVEIRLPGSKRAVRTIGPGEVFDSTNVTADEPQSTTAVAATDLQLVTLPRRALRNASSTAPAVAPPKS